MPTKKPRKSTIAKRPLDAEVEVEPQHQPRATARTISRAYGRAVAGFTLVALLLAGVIVTVTGSRASVTITPKVSERQVPFSISVVAGEASSTGTLPGRLLEMATTTSETVGIQQAPSQPDPDAKAAGSVTISNSSASPQQLVATTRLLSADGKLYRLVAGVTVPAKGSVVARVQADQPGAEFAIAPTVFTIPGLNPSRQLEVTAASAEAFALAAAGGSLTQEQIDAARGQALAAINERLKPLLQASLLENESLTSEAVTTTALELRTEAKPGDEVSSVTFSGDVRISATLFNERDLRSAAAAEAGPGADPSSASFTVQRAATGSKAIATVSGTVVVRATDLNVSPEDLTGRSKADARVYLELLPGVASAKVKLRPSWFSRLPQDPSRVTITVLNPSS